MPNFNWETIRQRSLEYFKNYPLPTIIVLLGLVLLVAGIFSQNGINFGNSKAEVIDTSISPVTSKSSGIIIQMAGAVEKPGVYHLPQASRVEDALIISGGVSRDADRSWVDKNLNLAAKLADGQKIYVPIKQSAVLSASQNGTGSSVAQSLESSDSNMVNINAASLSELDALPGIGQVYAQKITDNRPYSEPGELLSRKIVTSSIYEKIKDKISVY